MGENNLEMKDVMLKRVSDIVASVKPLTDSQMDLVNKFSEISAVLFEQYQQQEGGF